MQSLIKKLFVAAGIAAMSLAATATAQAEGEKYVLVSHAPDSDSWWNTIKNGIALGWQTCRCEVEYRNPPTGDIADMARIIEQAAASNPDGIITTLADFDVLKGPIKAAVDQGIDVIIMNTGTPEQAAKSVPLCMSVSLNMMPVTLQASAPRGEGVTKFLCVNHAIQQPTVGERCRGYADGLGVDLGNAMMDSGTDPSEIKNKVLAYLSANPDTNGILTLGPVSADPTIAALQENGMAGSIHFGTFDLGAEIVKGIKDGTINWGIDQQPFLQAYMPVVILANWDRYGVLPGNNINSGPGFVTKDGLTKVEEFAGEYR